MSTGTVGHYVAGSDRPISTSPVIYAPRPERPTGLDWDAIRSTRDCAMCQTPTPIDTLNDDGWCPLCVRAALNLASNQENPMPEPVVEETDEPVQLPVYILDAAILLRDTEGHPAPQVRAIRKIVTQALVALSASLPDPTPVELVAPAVNGKRLSVAKQSQLLLRDLGVTAAQVRAWARESGVPCRSTGFVQLATVQAYASTHHKKEVTV